MSRPPRPSLLDKVTLSENGTIELAGPSLKDLSGDLSTALIPAFEIGLAVATGTIKASFVALLGGSLPDSIPGEEIKNVAKGLREILAARGENDGLGRRLSQLISNSAVKAAAALFDRNPQFLQLSADKRSVLQVRLQDAAANKIVIDQSFLALPSKYLESLGIIDLIKNIVSTNFELGDQTLHFLLNQYRTLFNTAVWDEHANNRSYYEPLISALNSPFKNNLAWNAALQEHRIRVADAANNPVLDTNFVLSDIYLELRGATWTTPDHAHPEGYYRITNAHHAVLSWARAIDDFSIRYVSGGPGTGKSSLATMACATLVEDASTLPIIVRLLDFKWDKSGFEPALTKYIERYYSYFPSVPWSKEAASVLHGRNIILIFDGLDELAKALGPGGQSQGRALARSINEFVSEITPLLQRHHARMRALILGRTAAVQEVLRGTVNRHNSKELILLPLLAIDPASFRVNDCPVSGEAELCKVDQRRVWWARYAELTGQPRKFPPAFGRRALAELSSEPLTLALLAISGYHELKGATAVSVADVYRQILILLYKRDLARRAHAAASGLSFGDFYRALQVIGYSARFTTERSTTRTQLVQLLNDQLNRDRKLFERFEDGLQEGVLKLLLAAHVRIKEADQKGDDDEVAYEFSHKTFGEFLAAACLWRTVSSIATTYSSSEISDDMALTSLVRLIGRTEISPDFRNMLFSVVALPNVEVLSSDSDVSCRDETTSDRLNRLRSFHDDFVNPILKLVWRNSTPVHSVFPGLSMAALRTIDRQVKSALWLLRSAVVAAHNEKSDRHILSEVPSGMLERNGAYAGHWGGREFSHLSYAESGFVISGPGEVTGSSFFKVPYVSAYSTSFVGCKFSDSDCNLYGRNVQFVGSHFHKVIFDGHLSPPRRVVGEEEHLKSLSQRRVTDWLRGAQRSEIGQNQVAFVNCEFDECVFYGGVLLDILFKSCRFSHVTFDGVVFVEATAGFDACPDIDFKNCYVLDAVGQIRPLSNCPKQRASELELSGAVMDEILESSSRARPPIE